MISFLLFCGKIGFSVDQMEYSQMKRFPYCLARVAVQLPFASVAVDHWPQSLLPNPPRSQSCHFSSRNMDKGVAHGSCNLATEPCLWSTALIGSSL